MNLSFSRSGNALEVLLSITFLTGYQGILYSWEFGSSILLDTAADLGVLCMERKTDHGVTGVTSGDSTVGTITSISSTQCLSLLSASLSF